MLLDRGRVYGLMAERGYKAADLHRAAQMHRPDITYATVWNAANGKRDVSLEVAQAIASALNTTVDFLTGASEHEHPNGYLRVSSELEPLVEGMAGLPPLAQRRLVRAFVEILEVYLQLGENALGAHATADAPTAEDPSATSNDNSPEGNLSKLRALRAGIAPDEARRVDDIINGEFDFMRDA